MKSKLIGFVLGAAMLIGATPVFAASISDARFSNNQTSIDATGGSTVSGTFTLTVNSGEVVEWFRFLPAGNPFTEASVGGQLGYQENVYTNVPFSVKVPPNTGTYNIDAQGAGIWGGNRSINGADGVVVGPTSIGTVRVVADANNTTTTGGGSTGGSTSVDSKLDALIAAMTALTNLMTHNMSGGTGAHCPVPTGDTSVVQQWLMSNGYGASFYAAGVTAPTGHWGPITTAAYAQAQAACK